MSVGFQIDQGAVCFVKAPAVVTDYRLLHKTIKYGCSKYSPLPRFYPVHHMHLHIRKNRLFHNLPFYSKMGSAAFPDAPEIFCFHSYVPPVFFHHTM